MHGCDAKVYLDRRGVARCGEVEGASQLLNARVQESACSPFETADLDLQA
jgi:hypothetical protein